MIHLDTSFLIDLLRESRRRESGPATAKLAELADEALGISLFVLCELEAGAAGAVRPEEERGRIRSLAAHLALALPTEAVARVYGDLLVDLESQGEGIATMDLLNAATALVEGARLLTRNVRHFERVRALEVVSYANA